MISTESRMRENRTSGLMSGGEETQRGTRLRHRRVAKAAGNSDSLDLRPARLPSTLPFPCKCFVINSGFLDCHHTPLDSSLGGALRLSVSAFNTWPACWEPRVTMRF